MPDLFDFFKENESQLHERPPEQAWQKLEKRLDKSRKRKQRGIRFMQLGTVALALLLLLLAAAMVWYFTRNNAKTGERAPTPRILRSSTGQTVPPSLHSFSCERIGQ